MIDYTRLTSTEAGCSKKSLPYRIVDDSYLSAVISKTTSTLVISKRVDYEDN